MTRAVLYIIYYIYLCLNEEASRGNKIYKRGDNQKDI